MAEFLIIEAANKYASPNKDGEVLIHPWDIENLSQKLPVVTNEDYNHALDVVIKYLCDRRISSVLVDIEKYEIIVEKKELYAAIELIRKLRENGIDIYQLQSKANSDTKSYAKGYTNGYSSGYASAMNDVTRFAEQRKRIEEEEEE